MSFAALAPRPWTWRRRAIDPDPEPDPGPGPDPDPDPEPVDEFTIYRFEMLSSQSGAEFIEILQFALVDPQDSPISIVGAQFDESDAYLGLGAANAFDGSIGIDGWSPTNPPPPTEWAEVELAAPAALGAVHIALPWWETGNWPDGVRVRATNDRQTWTTLVDTNLDTSSPPGSSPWWLTVEIIEGSYQSPPAGY